MQVLHQKIGKLKKNRLHTFPHSRAKGTSMQELDFFNLHEMENILLLTVITS